MQVIPPPAVANICSYTLVAPVGHWTKIEKAKKNGYFHIISIDLELLQRKWATDEGKPIDNNYDVYAIEWRHPNCILNFAGCAAKNACIQQDPTNTNLHL